MLRRYDFFLQSPLLGATQYETEFDWGGTHIWVSTCVVQGLRCFFIEPANGFFAINSVYGRNDDAMRFEFFNKARPPSFGTLFEVSTSQRGELLSSLMHKTHFSSCSCGPVR